MANDFLKKMMNKILTLTMNPAIDLNCTVDKVVSGQKLRCDELRLEAGGGGVNVARALHQLGANVCAIFPAGGQLGNFYRNMLEAEGLVCEPIGSANGMKRLNTNVRSRSDNQQYRFCTPGPEFDQEVFQKTLNLIEERLKPDSILVQSGSLPPGQPFDFHAQVADCVKRAGATLVLDAPENLLEALTGTSVGWITPNRKEFEAMVGHSVNDRELESELQKQIDNGPFENILLTLGSDGVIYAGAEGCHRLKAPEVEKVSIVGAGDSATAGLTLGLAEGLPHLESAARAVAAGAAAVQTPGLNHLLQGNFEALVRKVIQSNLNT